MNKSKGPNINTEHLNGVLSTLKTPQYVGALSIREPTSLSGSEEPPPHARLGKAATPAPAII